MVVDQIAHWAKRKGIDLVATADWTHPLWLRELKENLVEESSGLFTLKSQPKDVFFLLSTEIASIYTQQGRGHRIHNLVLAPSFEVVEKINQKLATFGVNLLSDGRPITNLSSIELGELVFSISPDCLIIPAHVWTPWYSLYGSRSGFDSLRECFGKFTDQILAIETGLSSDPAMNWRIKELDNRAILSFSDAHSPQKMGREATIFKFEKNKKPDYPKIKEAISKGKIASTIEFYPQEGKYHYTGHRACQVKQSPEETKRLGTTCPVCGKGFTVGVMHRVQELADRPEDFQPKKRPPYQMIVPLTEILSESLKVGVSSQMVENEYNRLTGQIGSEFEVLLKAGLEIIEKIAGPKVAEGIKKVREGKIYVDPGYDGVFGKVKIWPDKGKKDKQKQMSLF